MYHCHCIDDTVTSHLARIIHQHIESGLYTRPNEHHFLIQDLLHGMLHNVRHRRNYRRNDTTIQIFYADTVHFQHVLKTDGIFQFRSGGYCRQTLHKTDLLAVNAAHHNVCISNIYC